MSHEGCPRTSIRGAERFMPRLALIQMNYSDDTGENVRLATRSVACAADNGAQIICLPELATTPYFCHREEVQYRDLAEPIPGPVTDLFCRLAAQYGVFLVIPTYEMDQTRRYNSATAILPTGMIAGVHRKTSIPLSVLPDWSSMEKYYFDPGDHGFAVYDTMFNLRVGILICYERHFPEAARILALRGAEAILIPTATGGPAQSSWEIELRGPRHIQYVLRRGCEQSWL